MARSGSVLRGSSGRRWALRLPPTTATVRQWIRACRGKPRSRHRNSRIAARRGGGFLWYPLAAIAGATFEPGRTTNALHLVLRDRSRVKFLWLAADGWRELVEEWIPPGTR